MAIYGYAKSYAETYANNNGITFVALEDDDIIVRGEGFNITVDGHCVINMDDCFSYGDWTWTNWFGLSGYKIPLERYQEVFGEKYTKQIYDQNISTWGGNCFGLSATAAMFYLETLPVVEYTHDVGVLAAGGYDDFASDSGKTFTRLKRTSELTKLIERYQIWQESNECYQAKLKYIWSHLGKSRAEDFSYIIDTVKTSKEPIMLGVRWDDPTDGNVGHRMVIDSSREPEDIGNGWYRVFLYDPNYPYFEHFGDYTPKECYLQAENRFVELNVNNGQWRMAATVNGSGASTANIGYDSSGHLIPGSSINFMSARDIPNSFNTKATFSSDDDTTSISYACDNFSVKKVDGKLVFQMTDGKITYLDETNVDVDYYDGFSEGVSTGVAIGRLVLREGEYNTEVQNGAVSYSSDGDYAGVVTKEQAIVRNISSTELEIESDSSEAINVVIEDVTDEDFESVKTDIVTGDSSTIVSVDEGELTIKSDKDQIVDVEVITNQEEHTVLDVEIRKDEEKTIALNGEVSSSEEILSSNIDFQKNSYSFTGKAVTPDISVHDSVGTVLAEGIDYTISYENNVNPGTATVTITGIGSYTGTVTKTFMILPGKTTRGDMFNLANNVKVTWKEVPGAKYYKVYREGVTDKKETQKEPVIVTERLIGWDSQPGLTNGHAYRYKIVASLSGKGDPNGDSTLSYSKLMYRLKTVVIRSVKNTAPGKVTVKYDKTTSGDSYVLQYCERQDMVGAKTKVVLGANNTAYEIGGLKKGKTYYISIRVRKKVNGIDYYTTFGVAKKIKVIK